MLLKRSPDQYFPDVWQMVSGKIKEGESAVQSSLREIQEETGLKPEKFWIVPNINSFYTPDPESINLVPVFAVQVDALKEVKLSSEHIEYKWLSADEVKSMLAWAGQIRSVDIIVDYITQRKSFWAMSEVDIRTNN